MKDFIGRRASEEVILGQKAGWLLQGYFLLGVYQADYLTSAYQVILD